MIVCLDVDITVECGLRLDSIVIEKIANIQRNRLPVSRDTAALILREIPC